MTYVGPQPVRRTDDEIVGRRPVVATLDTGCGKHPWLVGVVKPGPGLDSQPIGYVDDPTDPEKWFDQVGALDGGIDPLAGHGTFIAGLIHQACPDADIVAWRIVGSDGPVVESDLVQALGAIAEIARRYRDGEDGGHPIDVLSLSMGYYHETPEDLLFDPTMYEILKLLGECGVSVVCSAGNDATARPMFPAAFTPWADGKGGVEPTAGHRAGRLRGGVEPQRLGRAVQQRRSVGARLRPGRRGDEHPAAVPGRPRAQARTEAYMRTRESIDPDDFSGSFALWSGTSFSAPLFAGRVAAELVDRIDAFDDPRGKAVERTWQALARLTDLAP